MPSPKPNQNESKNEYISRCTEFYINENKEKKQALAICYSLWDRFNKNIIAKLNEYITEDFEFDMKLIKKSILNDSKYNGKNFEELAKCEYDLLNECFNLNYSFEMFLNLMYK